jgi:diaminopimelate epimerase
MRFAKGHGTGNDFVILPDPDGLLELPGGLVARICDRHAGLGADGILRVVRTAAAGEPRLAGQQAEWFMDYRNSDGSIAEMCGNGIRVFARYLLDEGLADGPELGIATRAGERAVLALPDGQFAVDMGAALVIGPGAVETGGQRLAGLAISVGNPHLACMVDRNVAEIDLTAPRLVAPAELVAPAGVPGSPAGLIPAGVRGSLPGLIPANVEVVRPIGDREVEMRVHERGSGLTLSCGTGAVAAAVAAAVSAGEWPDGPGLAWGVRVPGGRLSVTPSATNSLLTGPAEIVATGELSASWLAGRPPVRLSTS